jgi:hypothetical protein
MKLKAVIHVDSEDESRLTTAIGNIENFFDEIASSEADLRLVANSKAVQFFRKTNGSEYVNRTNQLAENGVRILVCNNSLEKMGIPQSELIQAAEVIPAGIEEIIRMQNDGYAYVKP